MKTMRQWMMMGGVLSFAIAASAVASTKSGLNSFSIGNSQAGAKGSYTVSVLNSKTESNLQISTDGSITFMNRTAHGVGFSAMADNNNGRKTAAISLTVANYTVQSGTQSAGFTWSKPVSYTLVQASEQIMVGPVPVVLSGAVGAAANVSYSISLSATGVSVNGTASANLTGSASAGVGVKLLNLAVNADLELAKPTLTASVSVTPTSWAGNSQLQYYPMSINFSVALMTLGKAWYTYPLGNYSAPSHGVTLLQLP